MRLISFSFLLATTCVWVWMASSLHSVATGSRDRANVVSLIIIIIIIICTKNAFVLFLSGVPAWRLMQVYNITVGFSPILYF